MNFFHVKHNHIYENHIFGTNTLERFFYISDILLFWGLIAVHYLKESESACSDCIAAALVPSRLIYKNYIGGKSPEPSKETISFLEVK